VQKDYEVIKLFGKDINIRNYLCSENPDDYKLGHLKVNLYIKVNDVCNARCKFCSNNNIKDNGKLNLEKLRVIIKYLNGLNILNKISITGGEPLLDINLLNDVLNLIYSLNPTAMVTINTNGYNLKNILKLDSLEKILGIHISRHHYDDIINDEIFGTKMVTNNEILEISKQIKNKKLLRLNCMLMKNSICNIEEVKKYLEKASEIGIYKVGFVSLMKVNKFCEDNFIHFNEVFNDKDKTICTTNHFYGKNICECINGIYAISKGKSIEYYARITNETKCNYLMQFVYTTDNRLTTGFGEETII